MTTTTDKIAAFIDRLGEPTDTTDEVIGFRYRWGLEDGYVDHFYFELMCYREGFSVLTYFAHGQRIEVFS